MSLKAMGEKIRIGIVGYGNLGRGVELALANSPDMELAGIFTRRDPAVITPVNSGPGASRTPVYRLAVIDDFRDQIDLLILCGGSRSDLPEQGPALAARFNTVDSFDTHARIPEYFAAVDEAARSGRRVSIISVGWDPGLFSLNRLIGEAILPDGDSYTFWGTGLSQGHSDAVRRIPGVEAAVQYTIPSGEAIERVRGGGRPRLTVRERHRRECYVVLSEGADPEVVREAIVTMPDYFADHETTVHFITEGELRRDHSAMPHGGLVIRSGETGAQGDEGGSKQLIEYSLSLESNPEFTASVLVAYARAAFRIYRAGESGARTIFDIAPGLLSPKDPAELRRELL